MKRMPVSGLMPARVGLEGVRTTNSMLLCASLIVIVIFPVYAPAAVFLNLRHK